jgi:hypothetical protein
MANSSIVVSTEATRREYIEQVVKPAMKARKLSGAEIARQVGVSSSQVNLILRGDYPYRGSWNWTRYMDEYFMRQMGLPEFLVWQMERQESEVSNG